MKTHTPGPWLATPTTGNPSKPYTVRMDIVTTTGEWNPAFVAGDILPEDARLIASAPDLLAACEAVVNDCDAILDGDDMSGMSDQELFSAIRRTLTFAITKAKGGAL